MAKLNESGSALVYSTYLGGNHDDQAFGIAVDSAGSAYVAGRATSTNFPTTPGAFQAALAGSGVSNAFVAKLDPTGSALVYSTLLGGSGGDNAQSIAVDSSGNAYVTGYTQSANFPTASPLQASLGASGGTSAFVTKLDPAGSALVYSTYLGGSIQDFGYGIAVDASGNAYVAGATSSPNFPTAHPLQASLAGGVNAFVAKLNAAGSALVYSTFLGGSRSDQASAIAVDPSGDAYVTGSAASNDFPTVNPLQATLAGHLNAFVAELNPAGSALVYSTYLGGGANDYSNGIAVDSTGSTYVTGYASSTDFPARHALQANLGGASAVNAFVAKLSPMGSGLSYSTSLGGSSLDWGQGIAVDSSGNAFVTGFASSSNLPVIEPLQSMPGWEGDASIKKTGAAASLGNAFVAKVGSEDSPGIAFGPGALTFPAQIIGMSSAPHSVTLTAAGSQPLEIAGSSISGDFALTTTSTSCPYHGGTVAAGATCTIDVIFKPTATGARTGTVTIDDNAGGSTHSIPLQGTSAATAPLAAVTPSSINFAAQLLGTTSAAQPVTLSNTGNAPLILTAILASGDFSQVSNCGGSVAAGTSCTINVFFSPPSGIAYSTPATLTGALTITDNSGGTAGSTQTVSLSGTWQDFALVVPPKQSASATVLAGQTASYTLSVVGEGGFNQAVALSCGGIPTQSTCTVTPNPTLPGANFTLLVTTTAPTATAPRTLPMPPIARPPGLLVLAVLLAGITWSVFASGRAGKRLLRVWLPLAAGLLLALALAGCGGGGGIQGNYGTSPGTYTLNVMGTANSNSATSSHNVTVTLKVT